MCAVAADAWGLVFLHFGGFTEGLFSLRSLRFGCYEREQVRAWGSLSLPAFGTCFLLKLTCWI